MFRSRVAWSLLRRTKDVIGTYKLRGTRPASSFSAEDSSRFFYPTIARRYLHIFRSQPKGPNVPYKRSFCNVASTEVAQKEGVKLLVTGGPHAQKVVGIWLFGSAAWVFSMVVLGGVTRLTRSGLSMTDWKFTGNLPPLSDEEWKQEFEKYKQSPEYKRYV